MSVLPNDAARKSKETLTVLTTYYNFHHNRRMRNNAMHFLQQMRAANVHVVLVELALDNGVEAYVFGVDTGEGAEAAGDGGGDDDGAEAAGEGTEAAGEGTEAAGEGDRDDVAPLEQLQPDTLLQHRVQDAMDYKDTALNLALAHIPDGCEYVCWCDCDIVFDHPRWADIIYSEFRQHSYSIIQPFYAACLTETHCAMQYYEARIARRRTRGARRARTAPPTIASTSPCSTACPRSSVHPRRGRPGSRGPRRAAC